MMIAPALKLEEEETARRPFMNAKTFLGALRKSVRPGISAAMAVEEGSLYAERRYQWTGFAAAGALVAEGLWTWQLEKERREREQGLQR